MGLDLCYCLTDGFFFSSTLQGAYSPGRNRTRSKEVGETHIFVLDPQGNMLVHSDPAMEGKNQLDLKDIDGKPIIRGLISATTTFPNKPEGWYHYEFPVPGGLLPRWKSTFVQLVTAPSGKSFIVGSGMYNDRIERGFVVDHVKDAVGQIEKNGDAAFRLFHDPTGPFIAKDAYVCVQYKELGGDYFERLNERKTTGYLVKRLRKLGYQVELTQPEQLNPKAITPIESHRQPAASGRSKVSSTSLGREIRGSF